MNTKKSEEKEAASSSSQHLAWKSQTHTFITAASSSLNSGFNLEQNPLSLSVVTAEGKDYELQRFCFAPFGA